MSQRWVTPRGYTVEGMHLEYTRPAKRDYDPSGGDGTYLVVRAPDRLTVKFVTGERYAKGCGTAAAHATRCGCEGCEANRDAVVRPRRRPCLCRTGADALAEVGAVLARQGHGETIRDLGARRLRTAA